MTENNKKKEGEKEMQQHGNDSTELFQCVPEDLLFLPPYMRYLLGWIFLLAFTLSFLIVPVTGLLFLMPWIWIKLPITTLCYGIVLFALSKVPTKEWPPARKLSQLWYEIFNLSVNMSPATRQKFLDESDNTHLAVCMHPHGIIPYHGLLWSAYCDQYLVDKVNGKFLYGFGAVADIVMQLPLLRTFMGWLACGSASYSTLKAGISEGKCECVNKAGRKPRHLFILPGGIAEIFTATPGKNKIVFKKRKGLIKLAIETGTHLIPCYVFGGADYFHNFATGEGFLSKLSRKYRIGITMFFGHFGLPIPFTPRITMCFADPLPISKWTGEGPVPKEQVEALHNLYLQALQDIFEKYKVAAGYPDAELEII